MEYYAWSTFFIIKRLRGISSHCKEKGVGTILWTVFDDTALAYWVPQASVRLFSPQASQARPEIKSTNCFPQHFYRCCWYCWWWCCAASPKVDLARCCGGERMIVFRFFLHGLARQIRVTFLFAPLVSMPWHATTDPPVGWHVRTARTLPLFGFWRRPSLRALISH